MRYVHRIQLRVCCNNRIPCLWRRRVSPDSRLPHTQVGRQHDKLPNTYSLYHICASICYVCADALVCEQVYGPPFLFDLETRLVEQRVRVPIVNALCHIKTCGHNYVVMVCIGMA